MTCPCRLSRSPEQDAGAYALARDMYGSTEAEEQRKVAFVWPHCLTTRSCSFPSLRQVVVDVRNGYEIRVGKFKRAVDPRTASFREFPAWIHSHLLPQMQTRHHGADSQRRVDERESTNGHSKPTADREQVSCTADTEAALAPHEVQATEGDGTNRHCLPSSDGVPGSPVRVAMYCTGGIRCEKATAYLVQQGVKEVSNRPLTLVVYCCSFFAPACTSSCLIV